MFEERRKTQEQTEQKRKKKGGAGLYLGETTRGSKEVTSQKGRSKRWERGEERRAGTLATVSVAKEQMALRGAATAATPGHRPQCRAELNEPQTYSMHTKTLDYHTALLFSSTSSFSIHQSIFHSLCPHS